MKKIILLFSLCLIGMQGSELYAKTKGADKADTRAAQRIIDAQGTGKTRVTIKTSAGKIVVMLYDDTPLHRDNFIAHINNSVYNGVIFHRVIREFMIQAGDPDSRQALATAIYGSNDEGEDIPAEIREHYFHHAGALAAARMSDEANPERKSSGSQFYIVHGKVQDDEEMAKAAERIDREYPEDHRTVYTTVGGAPHLDTQYTVFGRVVGGMKTVDKIATTKTDRSDRPVNDIYIKSMRIKTGK